MAEISPVFLVYGGRPISLVGGRSLSQNLRTLALDRHDTSPLVKSKSVLAITLKFAVCADPIVAAIGVGAPALIVSGG